MYATQFISTSSSTLKENIVALQAGEAEQLFVQLNPVSYNLKAKPDRQLLGFIAEDTPTPLAVAARGVDVMGIAAVLTRIVQSQRETIQDLIHRVEALEAGSPPP